jgi:hypothetical protein
MMARRGSVLESIQTDGRKFLAAIQTAISEREAELEGLRDNAAKWLAALNGSAPRKRGPGRPKGSVSAKASRRAAAAKPKRSSPTVDWDAILAKLPKSFTGEDLAKATPALRSNPLARNIALARWSRAGAIRKSAPGKYRKLAKS